MPVWVLEVKRLDTPCVLVPVWKTLRAGRRVFDIILSKDLVGAIHITDDDGDMLEPKIVAPRVNGNGPTAWSEELDEFDGLQAQSHPDHSNP